jgi:glycerophosphoryl diester phosphodiesterase
LTSPGRTLRLAHRGDWRWAPENSPAAFRAALGVPGCDGLEFDVRAAADGEPVVVHDETLARVQGRPERVDELGAAALRALGVPSLAEVLATLPGDAYLDVELKGPPQRAVLGVLEAGRGRGLDGAIVSSFEPLTLAWLARARPGWPRWLNALDLSPLTIEGARALGCAGISVLWRAVDARSARAVTAAGLGLAAWTVRRRATLRRLERLGVAFACVEAAALDG